MAGIHFTKAEGPAGTPLFAIGDVHGRLDLLAGMFASIDAELARQAAKDWRIILLGDYIDRGPDSKGVIEQLCARKQSDPGLVLLAGNHDLGLLDFLAEPRSRSLFARYGGVQTTLSYGVDAEFETDAAALRTRDRLLAAIPATHLQLLKGLELSVTFGDFFFCHAGIRPGVPLADQDSNDLIWIRDEFHDWRGLHPKIIVHGHTPVEQPEAHPNRVDVDTRAYDSGRLTALVVDGSRKRFLTVENSGDQRALTPYPSTTAWFVDASAE